MRDYVKYKSYLKDYMRERWRTRRLMAIELLGGKCKLCGTNDNLEFDHIDPAEKKFTIARGSSFSDKRFYEELRKCQLLCKSCHLDKTYASIA